MRHVRDERNAGVSVWHRRRHLNVHTGALDQAAVAAVPQCPRNDLALNNYAAVIAAIAAAEQSGTHHVIESDGGGGADDEKLIGV